MSVKIRLTRIGRHKDPFYRIVAADSHYARDGRYIEQIGTYDPALGIEKAVINEELALKWLNLGAQPSDSVKSMLTVKGIIAKYASSRPGKKPVADKKAWNHTPKAKTTEKKTVSKPVPTLSKKEK